MPGVLFVVATPIGNLEDLTFRALRTLRDVDLVAAEDTRRSSKLLAHYEIRKPLVSLREHNEVRETPRLVGRLQSGESIALVSDAGTPGISDPGARLVQAVRAAGIRVVPIPGPSAITAALSASGWDAAQFAFLGFPPPTGQARERWFDALAKDHRVSVFFEAPHRIARTLQDCQNYLVNRPIIVWRELSKIHEESVKSPIESMKAAGEFTIIVAAGEIQDEEASSKRPASADLADLIGYLVERMSVDELRATEMAARAFSLTLREALKIIKKHRYSAKKEGRGSP